MECEKRRIQLKEIIQNLSNSGKRIAGYGATSKSTTILNYCQIGNDLIEYICDTTPEKQGRLTPGSHIPVISREEAQEMLPDYFILFAWNHAAEIMALESERMPSKVEWISIIPKIEIVPNK
jgi:methylation protein EvaC